MGFLASHVATIPKQGFQWYLIFLEAAYADDIKKEIDTNFSILAREVGVSKSRWRVFWRIWSKHSKTKMQ